MNILFAIRGFRVFTIYPSEDNNVFADKDSFIVITRRSSLSLGDRVTALRLTNTLYLEKAS